MAPARHRLGRGGPRGWGLGSQHMASPPAVSGPVSQRRACIGEALKIEARLRKRLGRNRKTETPGSRDTGDSERSADTARTWGGDCVTRETAMGATGALSAGSTIVSRGAKPRRKGGPPASRRHRKNVEEYCWFGLNHGIGTARPHHRPQGPDHPGRDRRREAADRDIPSTWRSCGIRDRWC